MLLNIIGYTLLTLFASVFIIMAITAIKEVYDRYI